jgi:hypothetical protein
MIKEPKVAKSFSWSLYFKYFIIINDYFFHIYPIHALIYVLKFILELKMDIYIYIYIYILNKKMTPFLNQ